MRKSTLKKYTKNLDKTERDKKAALVWNVIASAILLIAAMVLIVAGVYFFITPNEGYDDFVDESNPDTLFSLNVDNNMFIFTILIGVFLLIWAVFRTWRVFSKYVHTKKLMQEMQELKKKKEQQAKKR